MKIAFTTLFLLFVSIVFAQTDSEPNNSFSTASPLGYNTQVTGTIGCANDDADYYKGILTKDGTMRIYIERTNNGTSGQYFYLSIFDKSQTLFYNGFDGYIGTGETRYDTINIYCRAADSIYLRAAQASACLSYKLRYEVVSNNPPQLLDVAPNESFETAAVFGSLDTVKGSIKYLKAGFSDDDDYYKTLLPRDGILRVFVQRTNTSTSNGGYLYLSIYDKGQGQIYNNFNGYVNAGETRYDTIDIHCRAADSMYFRLNSGNTCFSYKLRYEVINTNPPQPFDIAPNETFATAANISEKAVVNGSIKYVKANFTDDNDYYKTLLPRDGILRIYLQRTNTSTDNGGYFYLSLYDKNQAQFYNDFNGYVNAGETRYDTVDIHCLAADSMYFRINTANTCFGYKFSYEVLTNDAVQPFDTAPNESFETATNFNIGSDTIRGRIKYVKADFTDNDDYYKTYLPKDGILRIFVERTNTSTSNGGYTYLTLYDKAQAAFYNDYSGYVDAGATRYDTVYIHCRAADSIYFRMNNASTCFSYKLRYEVISEEKAVDTTANDNFSTATNFSMSDTVKGTIQYAKGGSTDNNDFFKTKLPSGGTLRVYLERTNSSTSNGGYFYLALFDKNQNQFYSNYNGYIDAGATRFDTIKIYCRTADSVFFRISDASTCFTYKLRYEVTLGPDTTVKVCPGFTTNIGTLYNTQPFSTGAGTVKYENLASPGVGLVSTIVGVGTYRLSVYNGTDDCSRDTAIITVGSYPKPTPAFTINSNPQCFNGNSFTFTNTSTISSGSMTYQWTFGDNASSTEISPIHSYDATGAYVVKLVTTSNNGCKDSITKTVTVNTSPAAGFTINTTAQCLNGNSYTFNSTSSISSGTITYQWSFGDNTSGTGQNPAHVYTAAGTYAVKLVVTSNFGCKDSVLHNVTVYPKPTAGFSVNSTSQCFSGNSFAFTNTSTIESPATITYLWSFGDNTSSALQNPTKPYTTVGTYSVKLVVTSSNGCKDSVTKTVTVYPDAVIGADKSITIACSGGTVDITTLYNTTSFSSAVYSTATPTVASPGSYSLVVTNAGGCRDTANITVIAAPTTDVPTIPNQVIAATRECPADAQGWTNYYNDKGTPADFSDDILILSIKKNGQNIGTIGDGTFTLKTATTVGAGSNTAVMVTNPLIQNASGFYAMNRYWQVNATTQPSANIGVRFYYNTQDLTDVNGSHPSHAVTHDKLLFYVTNGNPDPTTNLAGSTQLTSLLSGAQPTATTYTHTQVNTNVHYAEFMVAALSGGGGGATGNFAPLPVKLQSFSANLVGKDVNVEWRTSQEINTSHYIIERSFNGVSFENIARKEATGSSSSITAYQIYDRDVFTFGKSKLYYRLQIVDRDGKVTYSNVVTIALGKQGSITVYPNPVQHTLFIKISSSMVNKKTSFILTDASGKQVLRKEAVIASGNTSYPLNIESLAKGMYLLKVITKDEEYMEKIIKE